MSGKVIVRETSCRPMEIIDESGHAVVRETSVRESDCPGNVRYPLETRFWYSRHCCGELIILGL